MTFLQVGNENSAPVEFYHEDCASGNPVVLIHGWPLSGRSFGEAGVGLDERTGYRTVSWKI